MAELLDSLRVSVQVVEDCAAIVEGAQVNFVICSPVTGTWSVIVAVGFWLPSVAVTVADGVSVDVKVPVVAEKVALLCPDSTVTLAGTLSALLLLFTETVVLDVAAALSVTVQVEEAFEPIDEGVQPTDVSVGAAGIWSVTVVDGSLLASVAETVAEGVLDDVNVPVVAEKVALILPDNIVTLEGTVSAALLLCKETVMFAVAV